MQLSETEKSKKRRIEENFFSKYITGKGIDIGCGREYGYNEDSKIHESSLAHDLDMCDAHEMSLFKDETFDYVYASHILEHLKDPSLAIKNWYRICKTDGYIIICVPSWYRYEKKKELPSRWNQDHKRFYNFTILFYEIERALSPNSFVVEYAKDCIENFNWNIQPDQHSVGEYQIECVLKKIKKPEWKIQ